MEELYMLEMIVLWLLVNFGLHVPAGVTYTLLTSDGLPESKMYLRWRWVAATSTSVPCSGWLYLYHMNPVDTRSEAWFYGRSLAGIASSNPAGVWMPVSCECCVLSARGVYDEPIIRPEVCARVNECDRGNSWRRPKHTRVVEPWERIFFIWFALKWITL